MNITDDMISTRIEMLAVRDGATKTYNQPIFAQRGQVVRELTDIVNDEDKPHNFNKHPEDFTLYHVGYWHPQHGMVEEVSPIKIISLVDLKYPE